MPDLQQNIINWGKLAEELGCKGKGLACMRAAKSDKIKSIIEQKNLIFTPVADNRTLISSPAMRRSLGMITSVPVLIGTNSQEGSLLAIGDDDPKKFAQRVFGNDSKAISDVAKRYFVGRGGFSTGHEAVAQLITDFEFQCVSDSLVIKHHELMTPLAYRSLRKSLCCGWDPDVAILCESTAYLY
jgi:acetylcholinesterase